MTILIVTSGPRTLSDPSGVMGGMERPRRTLISVPEWLWGGHPKLLLDGAALHHVRDRDAGAFRVQTAESLYKRSGTLLTHKVIAGPDTPHPRFEDLRHHEELTDYSSDSQMISALTRQGERLSRSPDLHRALAYWRTVTAVCRFTDLPTTASDVYDALRSMNIDNNERLFIAPSIHIITPARALGMRAKLPTVWLRIHIDERLQRGYTQHLAGQSAPAFASSSDLLSGFATLDPYMAPLIAALAPDIWALPVPRGHFFLIYSLGRVIPSTSIDSADLMATAMATGDGTSPRQVEVTSAEASAAIEWWTRALDETFSMTTDIALYQSKNGVWDPIKQLQALMTVEQLFRRTAKIQINQGDSQVGPVLLFTVLDTLERLTGRPLETYSSLKYAEKTLEELRLRIPEDAQALLLPQATRAVTALKTMQGGFFLTSAHAADVDLGRSGQPDVLSKDRAVAEYIKVLRNATHGHGSNRKSAKDRTNALLAHHTGAVPADLALLAYLYVLDYISEPQAHWRRLATWP